METYWGKTACMIKDNSCDSCDLMLVLGSSLQVAPFCAVPNIAIRSVPRVLVSSRAHEFRTNMFAEQESRDRFQRTVSYSSWVKFRRRTVSLRPQWGPHFVGRGSSKYREQWVFPENTDTWTQRLLTPRSHRLHATFQRFRKFNAVAFPKTGPIGAL